MNIFGLEVGRKSAPVGIDEIIRRLEALHETSSGVVVTPENCEESPTVQSIVNAVSMRIATLPVHVLRKSMVDNREQKELLPNHPVARLLNRPNEWQTRTNYWLDAASTLVRYGRYFDVIGRGMTGPIRRLSPVLPSNVELSQDEQMNVSAVVTTSAGRRMPVNFSDLHYVRTRARDFLTGDSPVTTCRGAIALEIAAQRFGSEFFGNGAMPGLMFAYAENYRGHQTKEQRDNFVESVQNAYGKKRRFRALLLPQGINTPTALDVDNEKTQFLDTRKLQRNIIAGAFGVPPHLVGDLERGTFSNIEHQSQEFTEKVILPYVQTFEDAMERNLLSDDDRRSGVVIRFNLDAGLRADFKSRQEGLKIQREAGVISPNEWREREGMNPIPAAEGGESYWQQGPSGQTSMQSGATNADPTQRTP